MTVYQVQIVEDNPNPTAASFLINTDLLGKNFGKIIVDRKDDKVKAHVPLAERFFEGYIDCKRVDFFESGNETLITVTRSTDWTEAQKQGARNYIENKILNAGHQAISQIALLQNFPNPQKPFTPENQVQRVLRDAFEKVVNPVLAKDGGAMEIIDIKFNQAGMISADVALIGACNGCPVSTTTTLKMATEKLQDTIEEVKRNNSNNQQVQKLFFEKINVVPLNAPVFSRN